LKIGIQVLGLRGPRAVELAQRAEAAGFDGLWLPGGGENYIEAALLLNGTSRITVGTSIAPALAAYPAMHASIAQYLQELSGGRFVLGFGSQTKGQVRAAYGFDPPKIAKLARETIEVTRGILSGQPFEYDGEFLHRRGGARRQASDTPPPVYYSGLGPINLRIAGQYSEGFLAHPVFSPRYFAQVVWPEIDKGLARAGKTRVDFEMIAMPMTYLIEDESERPAMMSAAKRNLANYYTTRAYGDYMDFNGWEQQRKAIWEVAASVGGNPALFDYQALEDCVTDDMVYDVCLVGTKDEVLPLARERYVGLADYLDFYPIQNSGRDRSGAQEHAYEQIQRIISTFAVLKS
jgi:alkanesulfonate monooxygenase SsuD/methylene tetrahydromethanopterin reductase-like flavin-dependent oxidoreductase (luciferase family)